MFSRHYNCWVDIRVARAECPSLSADRPAAAAGGSTPPRGASLTRIPPYFTFVFLRLQRVRLSGPLTPHCFTCYCIWGASVVTGVLQSCWTMSGRCQTPSHLLSAPGTVWGEHCAHWWAKAKPKKEYSCLKRQTRFPLLHPRRPIYRGRFHSLRIHTSAFTRVGRLSRWRAETSKVWPAWCSDTFQCPGIYWVSWLGCWAPSSSGRKFGYHPHSEGLCASWGSQPSAAIQLCPHTGISSGFSLFSSVRRELLFLEKLCCSTQYCPLSTVELGIYHSTPRIRPKYSKLPIDFDCLPVSH